MNINQTHKHFYSLVDHVDTLNGLEDIAESIFQMIDEFSPITPQDFESYIYCVSEMGKFIEKIKVARWSADYAIENLHDHQQPTMAELMRRRVESLLSSLDLHTVAPVCSQ